MYRALVGTGLAALPEHCPEHEGHEHHGCHYPCDTISHRDGLASLRNTVDDEVGRGAAPAGTAILGAVPAARREQTDLRLAIGPSRAEGTTGGEH